MGELDLRARRRRNRVIAAVAVALCVVFVSFGLGVFAGAWLVRDCSFSPETWAAGRDPVVYEVLEHDLGVALDCDTLEGETAARVEQLLGRPDSRRATVWTYDVGIPGELLSDYPDLTVRFGSSGRVEDARIPGYDE